MFFALWRLAASRMKRVVQCAKRVLAQNGNFARKGREDMEKRGKTDQAFCTFIQFIHAFVGAKWSGLCILFSPLSTQGVRRTVAHCRKAGKPLTSAFLILNKSLDFQVLWSFRVKVGQLLREGWGICCGNSWSTELWDSGVFDVKTPVTWFGEKWGNLEGTGMDAMMQLMEEILCHFGILKAL